MDTVNIVLMIVLSVMIGFAIGNVWGRESMKRTMSGLLEQLTKGISAAAKQREIKKGE